MTKFCFLGLLEQNMEQNSRTFFLELSSRIGRYLLVGTTERQNADSCALGGFMVVGDKMGEIYENRGVFICGC